METSTCECPNLQFANVHFGDHVSVFARRTSGLGSDARPCEHPYPYPPSSFHPDSPVPIDRADGPLQPLSASYIRQTSEECHEPQSQLSIHNRMSNLSPNAAPSPPQPQEHSLTAGFFPSRAGRVGRTLTQASVAMHYTPPLQSPSQSPLRPTVTRDRPSSTRPPALPNSIVNSNGNGGRNANATVQGMRRTSPSPPPLSLPPSSFLQRFRVAVASHPYTAALIRGPNNSPNAHVGSASTGGDGAGEKPLSQIEGLQVSLLIAMPSPERHRIRRLQAKLELECNSDTSGVEGKGKEVRLERAGSLRLADELDGGGRPSLEAPDDLTLGEFVVGTTKVPWETGEAGVS